MRCWNRYRVPGTIFDFGCTDSVGPELGQGLRHLDGLLARLGATETDTYLSPIRESLPNPVFCPLFRLGRREAWLLQLRYRPEHKCIE
jgi:hypothetical protein